MLLNDHVGDNWQGEYALLLANSTGLPVSRLIISASGYWAFDQHDGRDHRRPQSLGSQRKN